MDNNNGWHHAQKFKHVQQQDGPGWVKERREDGGADRHAVYKGPRGGEYFTGSDGKQRSVHDVARHVTVYPEDKVSTAPSGIGSQGNGGRKKY
eukprot:UN03727